jgi:PAS domain S-box-containing protein
MKNNFNENIIEDIVDGFFSLDFEWRFTYLDQMAVEIVKREAKELIGKVIWDEFPNIVGTKLETTYRKAMESRVVKHIECKGFLEDGLYNIFICPTAEGISCYCQDITNFKIAEDKFNETEITLRKSEEMLRTILDNSRDAINMLDLKTGKYVYMSPAQLELSGLTKEEISNISAEEAFELVHPDDREMPKEHQKLISAGLDKNIDVEYRLKVKSGEYRWISDRRKLVQDEHGQPIALVGISRDITENKILNEALRENEERFHVLVDAIAQAVWETDALGEVFTESQTGNVHTFIECVNAIHPEDREYIKNKWREAVVKGQNFYEEYRLKSPNGEWRWTKVIASPIFNSDKKITKWVGMNMDIMQRKEMEEILRKSEEKYRALFNSMEEEFAIMDLQFDQYGRPIDAVILEANPSYERQNGVKNVIGKPASSLFPGHGDDWLDEYGLVAMTGKPKRFVKKAESLNKWHSMLAYKVGGYDSKTVAILGHDITEQKRAEAKSAFTLEKLMQSEKNAQKLVKQLRDADQNKNDYLNVLSHELRNPMAAISAGFQLLNLSEDKDQIAKAKDIIKRQMDHLSCLVDDLLDLTRFSNNKIIIKKERVELKQLTKFVMEDLNTLFANKGVLLVKDFDAKALYIDGDPVRLTQIIGNLLHNAIKFTDKNGKALVSIYEENNQAVICVKDTGIGIKSKTLPALFKPFVQADQNLARSTGGLGLGLSIVKSIAELHGGSVNAYSAGLGKGSSFYIYLPLLQTEGKKQTIKHSNSEIARSLRILIIEDNSQFAELLLTMLQLTGHNSSAVFNGAEGIERAKEFSPDVILCDIGLPEMDGFEVARRIRREESIKNVFMIALTGYAGQNDIERAVKAGFNMHLAKPIDFEILKKVLNEVKVKKDSECVV